MMPVMAISRAVLIRPMAMVTRPGVDAEYPVDTADRAAHRAAGDSANWTGSGIAFRRAALHSSNNALSMNRDRRGEQSRNRGKLQNFQHLYLQITQGRQLPYIGRLTPAFARSSPAGARPEFASLAGWPAG